MLKTSNIDRAIPLSYRPEIDGLRAVSVIAVVIYHAQFSLFGSHALPGGYLGVDVFFVISGYLIGRLINTELLHTGTFSFSSFYARRARRILPVLFTVAGVSLLYAHYNFGPDLYLKLSEASASALLLFSNWWFYFSSVEYGSEVLMTVPMLHTWSLSVEEQFYITLPLLLVLTFRTGLRNQLAAVVLISGLSLMHANFSSVDGTKLAFFSFFTRAWELCVGVLIGLVEVRPGVDAIQVRFRKYAGAISGIGLSCLLCALFMFTESTRHPSLITLIPVLSSATIIIFAHRDNLVGKILSGRGLVGMGLISYSLYLWHVPIFMAQDLKLHMPDATDKATWIFFSLIMAACSYRYIERPFRNRVLIPDKAFWLVCCGSLVVLVYANLLVAKNQGYPSRMDALYSEDARAFEATQREPIGRVYPAGDFREDNNLVLLIGDSYIANWTAGIARNLDVSNSDFLPVSYLGCIFSADQELTFLGYVLTGPQYEKNCDQIKMLADPKVLDRLRTIVFVGHQPMRYNNDVWRFELVRWLQRNSAQPVRVFIVGNYWQLDPSVYPWCLDLMRSNYQDASICVDRATHNTPSLQREALKTGAYLPEGISFQFIDLFDLLRSNDGWPYSYRGVPFMEDWSHLSGAFASYVIQQVQAYEGQNQSIRDFQGLFYSVPQGVASDNSQSE